MVHYMDSPQKITKEGERLVFSRMIKSSLIVKFDNSTNAKSSLLIHCLKSHRSK
jgi:hypothetical protein